MRAIDGDALSKKLLEELHNRSMQGFGKGLMIANSCVINAPTIESEIVHCRDCKHHWTHRCMDSMPTEICDLNQTFYDPNIDFCSLAERRTDEGD